MSAEAEAAEGLRLISKAGPGWDKAHQIARAHEGEAIFDAVDAFLHRIERDRINAGYWDRQAGTGLGRNGFVVETDRLRTMLNASPKTRPI